MDAAERKRTVWSFLEARAMSRSSRRPDRENVTPTFDLRCESDVVVDVGVP